MPAWTDTPCSCCRVRTSATHSNWASPQFRSDRGRRQFDHARSEFRLTPTFADVSNIDKEGRKLARDNKRRMAALGNRLWHSDASFRAVPAKFPF